MRKIVVGIYVLLLGCLFGAPSETKAGDYGCNSAYYQQRSYYSAPAYYTPRYTYPAGYYPQTYSQTPYVPSGTCVDTPNGTVCNPNYPTQSVIPYAIPTDVFSRTVYNVAPDLAQNRIAAEAAAAAINQLKIEMAKQAELAEAKADKAESRAIQQQLLVAITGLKQQQTQLPPQANYPPPQQQPAYDFEKDQLRADNAKLMATLQTIIAKQQAQSYAPPAAPPAPPQSGQPQAQIPPASPPGDLAARVKAHAAANCMPCHNAAPRLILTDPSKLTYNQLADCVNRMISTDPAFMMPKKGKNVELEVISDFQRLSMTVAK